MRTKYRVSNRDAYVGPISRMPDHLFERLEFTLNPMIERQISAIAVRNARQSDARDATESPTYNVNQPTIIPRPGYEIKLESKRKGFVKLYAGHMKHTFNTYGRSGKVRVLKGEMKVKCGTTKLKLNRNGTEYELQPNTVYYAKNNSLHNECVFQFVFAQNSGV